MVTKKGKNYEFVVLLEPTSPLRDHNDIDLAINKVIKLKAQSLVSVSKAVALHPAYLYKKTKTEKLSPLKLIRKIHS